MNLEETVPVEEVELIKKYKLPPPLFNDYLSGGYMIWALYPDYKVFIDSRGKPYELTHLWDQYHELMGNPTKENIRKILSHYPFRVALINLVYAETIIELLDNAGDEWRLLFLGRNAAILVHASIVRVWRRSAESGQQGPRSSGATTPGNFVKTIPHLREPVIRGCLDHRDIYSERE
jgi:hypothetical protein